MTVLFQKLCPAAQLPRRATASSAGYDLCACLSGPVTIAPGQTATIPTGLAMALPEGYGGFVFARSGLGIRHGGNCWWGCTIIPPILIPSSQGTGSPSWWCWLPPAGTLWKPTGWTILAGGTADLVPPGTNKGGTRLCG